MREAAFTEFHQVFAMRFHRLYGSASCRFFEFFGGMLFEKCKGGRARVVLII